MAAEVKSLADVIEALEAVTRRIREMDAMVNDIAVAVEGDASSPGAGLVRLAELLRAEVTGFVATVRQG